MQTATRDPHEDCSFHDEGACHAGDPEHCERSLAYRKRQRAKTEGAWSQLIARKEEPNGWRHYLDGEPVHCGEALELQAIQFKYDDYGEYHVHRPEGALVRYEANLNGDEPHVTLYADVKGHSFATRGEPYMRFRWPKKNG